jgi:hypothetical protein
MGLSQLLWILAFASMVFIHRSTVHTVRGGDMSLALPAFGGSARRTVDLGIIPLEHSGPWVGQGQFIGSQTKNKNGRTA